MQVSTKTAIAYCRVSYSDQVEGTSLDSQERICREYAVRQGLEIRAVFVERGESAKTADRTELNRAIAFCRRNHINFLIVYKLDRFTRNQEDHVMVRAVLRQYGTDLRSATEPIDDTPTGRMMEGILSAFSQFDNDMRTERTTQGMLERVKQGVWVWPEPLGYYRPTRGGNIVPDPAIAPLIRLTFEEYSKGIFSHARLASFLAARGLRARRGGRPTANLVRSILLNPIYCGIIKVWDRKFNGSFEPIVSRELFDACQPTRKKESLHPDPRTHNNSLFPLRGLLVCTECNRSLTGSQSRGGSGIYHPYYHHHFRDCSKSRSIPKDKLEDLFVEYLRTLTINPGAAESLREYLMDAWSERQRNRGQLEAVTRREITTLEGERQRVFELHRKSVYTDHDFQQQKHAIEEQIKQKSLLLQDRADSELNFKQALRTCLERASNPAQTWLESEKNYEFRLLFQRQVFRGRVHFDGERLRTADLGLIYQLSEAFQTDKKCMVDLMTRGWNQLEKELKEWDYLASL